MDFASIWVILKLVGLGLRMNGLRKMQNIKCATFRLPLTAFAAFVTRQIKHGSQDRARACGGASRTLMFALYIQ